MGRCVTGPQDNPQINDLLEGLTELRKAVIYISVTIGMRCPLKSARRVHRAESKCLPAGRPPSGTTMLNSSANDDALSTGEAHLSLVSSLVCLG